MNKTLKAALLEAYATAPSNVAVLDTVEIRHAMIPNGIFLVANHEDITARLEVVTPATEGVLQTFTASAFRLTMPSVDDSGLQQISITLDDVDGQIQRFVKAAKVYETPISLIVRPYLSNDFSGPQLDPPLHLSIGNTTFSNGSVNVSASFVDLINAKFLTELYTRNKFPGLGLL